MVPLHCLQVGLTWMWYLSSLPGYHRDMVPLHGLRVGLTWTWGVPCHLASPIPGDSGPQVGLLDLVNLVILLTTWESPGPGESGRHLGLTQSW